MGKVTKIEYADSTINPVMGCTGCDLYSPDPAKNHCYAATLVNRYKGRKGWPSSFAEPEVFDHRIPQALNWPDLTGMDRPDKPWLNGYPRIVFVNDLSDGFCSDVDPHKWLTPCIERMAESPHIWLLLTKWPHLMTQYFVEIGYVPDNFWLGTTVTEAADDWRLRCLFRHAWWGSSRPLLWVSVEPMLTPVGLTDYAGWVGYPRLSWIVAGGESGTNARPTHPEWADNLRRQAEDRRTPFFWKQWGAWMPYPDLGYYGEGWDDDDLLQKYPSAWMTREGDMLDRFQGGSSTHMMFKVGKKSSGRILDGHQWNQMPEWGF